MDNHFAIVLILNLQTFNLKPKLNLNEESLSHLPASQKDRNHDFCFLNVHGQKAEISTSTRAQVRPVPAAFNSIKISLAYN